MELKEQNIIINGRKTHYWRLGQDKKETILFLHGFPGNHLGLVDLAICLAGGYNIVMVDLPGCGQSENMDGAHTAASYADWLADFMESLGLSAVILLGHSFGARLTMYFLAQAEYKEKVLAGVLLAPVIKVYGLWPRLGWFNYLFASFLPEPWRKRYLANELYQHFLFWLTFKLNDQEKMLKIKYQSMDEVSRLSTRVYAEMFEDLTRLDLDSLGEHIDAACLIVMGQKDEVAPVKSAEELLKKIRRVTFKTMEGTGHLLPIEHPETTASIITQWLTGLSS